MGCSSSKRHPVVKRDLPAQQTVQPSVPTGQKASNDEDIRDKYELGEILGSGSFGQVRRAVMKGNETEVRAVKIIERSVEDGEWSNQAMFVREVDLLQSIKHENVISYYDFYEDMHFLYVVMELCKGGEVFAKIVELKRFCEKDAAVLGQQMLRAIDYIHKVNIAHRDIKAENFMLALPSLQSSVKMIDFGMACRFKDGEVLTELCGSPHYLSPELIGQKYNHKADVWAFGVLIYLLMYGHYPYDAKHPRDVMVKILTEPIRWQTKAKLSQQALDFLKRLLEQDPKKRMSADEALIHPWMDLASPDVAPKEDEELPVEVIRSAHKKVTTTRKPVDPKVEELRNEKLKFINADFLKGIRHGQRLGETPKEEYMSKPEFVRRANKITTAPSRDVTYARKLLENKAGNKVSPMPEDDVDKDVEAIDAVANTNRDNERDRRQVRSHSASGGGAHPARLAYIGALTIKEETNLASLYEQKLSQTPAMSANVDVAGQTEFVAVVPDAERSSS